MSVEVEYEVVIGAERIHATLRGGGEEAEFDATVSDDEQRKLQHDVQHLTDEYVKRIDEALAQKGREILQV